MRRKRRRKRRRERESAECWYGVGRGRALGLSPGAKLCPGVHQPPGGRVIPSPTQIMEIMELVVMAHCRHLSAVPSGQSANLAFSGPGGRLVLKQASKPHAVVVLILLFSFSSCTEEA